MRQNLQISSLPVGRLQHTIGERKKEREKKKKQLVTVEVVRVTLLPLPLPQGNTEWTDVFGGSDLSCGGKGKCK